jgi:D-3-phosphoglycerate dehydrogenase
MRERTPITKKIISSLRYLKLIITSGMRNKSIDFLTAKEKKILVCGTDSSSNSTVELTWALILGLARNLREESENMYQGY